MTAAERKSQSESQLKKLKAPIISELPLLEEEAEAKLRDAKDVAQRILILTYLNVASEDEASKEEIVGFLKNKHLWDAVSPKEKKLFEKPRLSEIESLSIAWQAEAVKCLLWSIQKINNLDLPFEEADINHLLDTLPEFLSDPYEFIQEAELRPTSEILDMSDFLYRLHSSILEIDEEKLESLRINFNIVYERHYAINWLTYFAEGWDEIEQAE